MKDPDLKEVDRVPRVTALADLWYLHAYGYKYELIDTLVYMYTHRYIHMHTHMCTLILKEEEIYGSDMRSETKALSSAPSSARAPQTLSRFHQIPVLTAVVTFAGLALRLDYW